MTSPVIYEWTPEGVMKPLRRFDNVCKHQFTVGEQYRLGEIEERSLKSHNHFFAAVGEAWKNLPEELAQEFATPEHLRKYCLIKTGYHDRHSIVLPTKADAVRVSSFSRKFDDFAIVTVSDCTVTRYEAKSQSARAMGKKVFQESKTAVLDMLDDMLGIDRGQTQANAGKAA